MIKKIDIVIIGGGPIGIFAIFEAGMLDMSCCLIESQDSIGGQCKYLYPEKPIYDIPAYPVISAEELIEKLKEQADGFKPVYRCGIAAYKITQIENNKFHVELENGEIVESKAVIISGGCGSFEPNKPIVENIDSVAKEHIHYCVESKAYFANKKVVIAGGGDSAVDWAVSLNDIAYKIYLVHRREKFRCHPSNIKKLYDLVEQGKVEMVIPYQLSSVVGKEGKLEKVVVKTISSDNTKDLIAEELLILFGLKSTLGHIENWGLVIENRKILVHQSNCVTNIPGIYAIGDIASYQGKLKLILTGFAEAATACYDIRMNVFADKVFNFEYSTNKGLGSSISN